MTLLYESFTTTKTSVLPFFSRSISPCPGSAVLYRVWKVQVSSQRIRESASPLTYFQAVLILFQTIHFEETTLTQIHAANFALNQP